MPLARPQTSSNTRHADIWRIAPDDTNNENDVSYCIFLALTYSILTPFETEVSGIMQVTAGSDRQGHLQPLRATAIVVNQ